MIAASCLVFEISCETLLKGGLATLMGFVLFVGSVLLLLAAVFGRRMGYLILAVSFFGWMILFSALWTFGFWSQGPDTPVDLGPRGSEPGWAVEAAGLDVAELPFEVYASYPDGEQWKALGPGVSESVQGVQGSVQAFLAEEANAEAGTTEFDPEGFVTSDFTVEDVRFATADGASLAAAHAFYNEGGPTVTVYLRHDKGSVKRYSWMFLIGSAIGLLAHLPFLDRAERKRKEILTGGTAPPWYGPA